MKKLVLMMVCLCTITSLFAEDGSEKMLPVEMEKLAKDINQEMSRLISEGSELLAENEISYTSGLNQGSIKGFPEPLFENAETLEINASYKDNDELFKKLSDIKGVEVVYISKSLLSMMPNINTSGVNIGSIASKLDGLQIFSSETKNAVKTLRAEAEKLIKNNKYETLMMVKDDTSKTVFYLNKLNSKESEMLMIDEDVDEITIIRFMGRFTVEDIQELTKNNN